MKLLGELSQSKSERVRLQAALQMATILLEHQRSEERKAIAKERKRASEPSPTTGQPETCPEPQDQSAVAERAARLFLDGIREKASAGVEANG